MKSFTILVIFVYSGYSYSQNNSNAFRDSIDAVFSTLDQDSISTGILLNKCMPLFNIEQYNTINDTQTNFSIWRGIYRSMYLGSFNRIAFISDDSIDDALHACREAEIIPVFILNYRYNYFKPYAIDSNLIEYNANRFYDINSRSQSPYLDNRTFNACSAFKVI
ncbi:MAG: hypothetical protein ACK4ON_13485 [Bacteroidia bacterium]